MQILLAKPRGFCAGVNRAINIVENALKVYGRPIYVRHELVHNSYVVNNLRKRGVIFVERVNEVPDGSILIFSAHGVSKSIRNETQHRKLTVLDATCPLVSKIHMKVARASKCGEELILIGHAGHPEVQGTIGHYDNPTGKIHLVESIKDVSKLDIKNETKLSFVTQTTLSIDDTANIINELRIRFPKIISPRKNDICYATTNRQNAVRKLAKLADIVLIIGSRNSSNSNRLVELSQRMGKKTFLIDNADEISETWIKGITYIGIAAGASVPNILIQNTIDRLKTLGSNQIISLDGDEENVIFKIPRKLLVAMRKINKLIL